MSEKERSRARFLERQALRQDRQAIDRKTSRRRTQRERGLDAVARNNYDLDRDDLRDISPEVN